MSLGQVLAVMATATVASAFVACSSEGAEPDTRSTDTPFGSVTAEATATDTPALNSTATTGASPGPSAASINVHVFDDPLEHRVWLEYPAAWTLNRDYYLQFDGQDGFVQIGDLANGGRGLDDAVASIAHHKLMPYGSNPTLEPVVVDGVSSVLVRPSNDQMLSNAPLDRRHVAVVIPRVEPLRIGGEQYEYTVLYLDEVHAESILKSVRLLLPK